MNKRDCNDHVQSIANYLADDPDCVKKAVENALNAALEAEMTEFLGAAKGERTSASRVSLRALSTTSAHEGWHDRVDGAPGTGWSLKHAGLRAGSSVREGVGIDPCGHVRERCFLP